MKILTFVDIHGSRKAMDEIKDKAKDAEMLVCAGDVSIFGQNLKENLKELEGLKKPIIIIHGNHENVDEMEEALKDFNNFMFIHEAGVEFDDYFFLGYGGGGFSSRDKEFEAFSNTIKERLKGKKVVLVTHAPPYDTRLDRVNGSKAGSKSIRKFIEKYKPMFAISGHLHENAGKEDKIGESIVVNPGPFGKLIDV